MYNLQSQNNCGFEAELATAHLHQVIEVGTKKLENDEMVSL
jgi:hypothetical protein